MKNIIEIRLPFFTKNASRVDNRKVGTLVKERTISHSNCVSEEIKFSSLKKIAGEYFQSSKTFHYC